MSEIWFTSDHHFGHKNIIEFENQYRPFKDIYEHDQALIKIWNAMINDNDTVYYLGDFAFGRQNVDIADALNGKKILIMGNHDHYPIADYMKYFHKIYGVHTYHQLILSHIPIHPKYLEYRWKLNVHGHLHSKRMMTNELGTEKVDGRYFNVSIEQNELKPFHVDEIFKRMDEIK